MQTKLWILLLLAFALLIAGTVMVFLVLDRHSHSASDTLRPFVITMLPVWANRACWRQSVTRAPERELA